MPVMSHTILGAEDTVPDQGAHHLVGETVKQILTRECSQA